MSNNQVKPNEDKTEVILFSSPSPSFCRCLQSSVMVCMYEIAFSDKVGNFGFNLVMKQHVIKICQIIN